MNREILFRAKRKDNGEWIYGNLAYIQCDYKYYIIPFLTNIYNENKFGDIMELDICEVITETIGQYTGLTDKNGKKIFEGDILKCHYANAIKDFHIEQVVFYKGKFMAYGKLNGAVHWTTLYDGISRLVIDKSVYMDEMEVIGNIHDEVQDEC